MKRMNIVRSVGMTLLATVLIASVVFAQRGNSPQNQKGGRKQGKFNHQQRGDRPGRRSGREMGLGFFRGDLNLSDEQKTQVQEKSREFQLATEETRLKLRFAQQDLRMAMQQEPVDQAKIDSLWADIAGLRQVQDEARIEQLLELKNLLTDEQLASLQARENAKQELQTLKAEFHGMLLTSGEIDTAKLQELQAEITEKELVLEKERAEKRAARQDDFTKRHGRRKMSKAVKE